MPGSWNKPYEEKDKALTLAMGVAVVTLSKLGNLEVETAVSLLGIGLACAGVALLAKH